MKLITFLSVIVLVSANLEGAGADQDQDCSCFHCLKTNLCSIVAYKRNATKLLVAELFKYGMATSEDINAIDSDMTYLSTTPCIQNKVSYIIAFLLELPKPSVPNECISTSRCTNDTCFEDLQNFQKWKPFEEVCLTSQQEQVQKALLSDTIVSMRSVIKSLNTSQIAMENFAQVVQGMTGVQCQPQKQLNVSDVADIILKLFSEHFQCEVDKRQHYTLDTSPSSYECDRFGEDLSDMNMYQHEEKTSYHNGKYSSDSNQYGQDESQSGNGPQIITKDEFENKPVSYVIDYLSEKLSFFIRASNVIEKYRPYAKCSNRTYAELNSCGIYNDEYLISKTHLLSTFQKQIFGCTDCAEDENISAECKPINLIKSHMQDQVKQKSLKYVFEKIILCHPYDNNCLQHGKRDRSEDAFRFISSIFKEVIGCDRCTVEPLQCSDGGNCDKDLILPLSTKYHAISEMSSITRTCELVRTGILQNEKLHGDSEFMTFYQDAYFLYKFMNKMMSFEETLKIDLADSVNAKENLRKEQDCRTTQQLQMFECSSHLVKLKVKLFFNLFTEAAECETIVTPAGITSCKPDYFYNEEKNCSSNSMNVLPFMILSTCLFSGCLEDPFQRTLVECSVYAVILDYPDKIFGEITPVEALYEIRSQDPNIFKANPEGKEMVRKLYEINKCQERCPNGYKYCPEEHRCVYMWNMCSVKDIINIPHFQLPIMYSINSSSEIIRASKLSARSISVFHKHGNDTQDGGSWQYELDGRWHNINKLLPGTSVKLDGSCQIRYYQSKVDYGLKVLYFYDDASSTTIGGRTKIPSDIRLKLAFILIHPRPVPTNFTMHSLHKHYRILEDENYNKDIDVSEFVHVHTPVVMKQNPISSEYIGLVPKEDIMLFERNMKMFEESRPFMILKTDMKQYGDIEIVSNADGGMKETRSGYINKHIPLDLKNAKIRYTPKLNYNGNFSIQFEICNCFADQNKRMTRHIEISFEVVPVNDRPTSSLTLSFLPAVAFNLTAQPSDGFTVEELLQTTKAYDVESGTDIGIGIYQTPVDKTYGVWQYLNSSNQWEEISVKNDFNIFDKITTAASENQPSENQPSENQPSENQPGNVYVRMFLLNKTQKLRFQLSGDKLWPFYVGIKTSFFGFCYWDKSDFRSGGYHQIYDYELTSISAYSKPAVAVQLRRGCDNKPGSLARYDTCGICGGNGKKCFGCDGVKDSGAVVDHCGNCTGGQTNLTFNFMKDCANTCGLSDFDECNKCQIKNVKYRRQFKDCNGDCFGRALVDRCGICAGGKTNIIPNVQIDTCGVCFGNGSTCVGCDGIVNSGKTRDLCGNCLLPKNPKFNSRCLLILSISPMTTSSRGGEKVLVRGAGFTTDAISCSFSNESLGELYNLRSEKGSRNPSSFMLVTPSMSRGYYSFSCWIGDNTEYRVKHVSFFVYEDKTLTLHTIYPDRLFAGEQTNVTVKGTGFQNTGETTCVLMAGQEVHEIPLTLINNETAVCHFGVFNKSAVAVLGISLTKRRWIVSDIKNLPTLPIKVYVQPPFLKSAKISDDFRFITFTFSKPATCANKKCTGLFSDIVSISFGKKYKIEFSAPTKLVVKLGWNASVRPGDHIVLQSDSVKTKYEMINSFTPITTVILVFPDKALTVKASITSLRHIGLCDPLIISGRKSEGGGRLPLQYKWNVNFSTDTNIESLSPDEASSVNVIRAKLSALPSSQSTLRFKYTELQMYNGINYEFTLNVTNFLDSTSETVSVIVTRNNENTPQINILGGLFQDLKAGRLNKIQAKSRLPKCFNMLTKSPLSFSWEIDRADIVLDSKSKTKSSLYIYPGTLVGGETYVLTLTVSITTNPLIMAETSVTLKMNGEKLFPLIKGGDRVVSKDDNIKLDASKSLDPDKSQQEERFEWECFDKDDIACFVRDENNTNQYVRFQIASQPKVTIYNNSLNPNETYKFKLLYHKGSRVSTRTTKVRISPSHPPKVVIKPRTTTKENVENRIKIKSFVKSVGPSVRIWLDVVEDEGYGYVNITEPGVLLTPIEVTKNKPGFFPFGVVFNKNVFYGGVTYKFMVYAQSGNETGYAEIVFTTNVSPTVGILSLDQTIGTALTTEFMLDASEGWEDDVNDYPLTYVFGYYSNIGHKHYLGAATLSNVIVTTLPNGNPDKNNELEVFVEVKDIHGATSETTVNVTVEPLGKIDEKLIQNISALIEEAVDSDDMSSVLGTIASTIAVFQESQDSTTSNSTQASQEEMKLLLTEFKENATKNVVTFIEEVEDLNTQNIIIKNLADITYGGEQFSDAVKQELADKVSSLVYKQITSTTKETSARRKRRETEEAATTNGKTIEEVEDILKSYDNIISPTLYTNSSMNTKKSFTELSSTLLSSMCQNAAFGEGVSVAKSNLANFQISKNPFANVDSLPYTLGCRVGCNVPAETILGNYLQDLYKSWTCSEEEECAGACIGSVIYPKDLFTSNSTGAERISDIVSIELFNPILNEKLNPGQLLTRVELHVPFKNESDAQFNYKCEMWDRSEEAWSQAHCVSMNSTKLIYGISHGICLCEYLGVVSMIQSSGLTFGNAAVAREEPSRHAEVQIRSLQSLEAIITRSGQVYVEETIKSVLVNKLSVEEWRIRNVTALNYTYVQFDFLPPDEKIESDALTTFNRQFDQLKELILNSTVTVEFSDGISITIDSTYFNGIIAVLPIKRSTQIIEESSLLPLYIASGVIAGVVLIGISVGVIIKYKLVSSTYVV